MTNWLFYGDNIDVLRRNIDSESADLIYLDPPFNSNRSYNVLFKTKSGEESQAQIEAFNDTWTWSQDAELVFKNLMNGGAPNRVADAIDAMRRLLDDNDVLAYLVMMTPRLLELHRVLKPTGSLYLHCDPTASHYLKIIMDAIFGPTQFRNEIIWRRSGSHNSAKRYGPNHDVILFYTKTDQYFYRVVKRPYMKGHVDDYFKNSDDKGRYWGNALTGAGTRKGASGQPWRGYDPTAAGRHWAIPGLINDALGLDASLPTQTRLDALDEAGYIDHPGPRSRAMPTYRQYLDANAGSPLQDLWTYQPHTKGTVYGSSLGIDADVAWLSAQGDAERLRFQTQKPRGLLERIIRASCPDDGLVLDPFCGCGTTVDAAENLGRRWQGIDVTYLAVNLIDNRLRTRYGDAVAARYKIDGIPTDVEGARALWDQNAFDFERWAVSLVQAEPNIRQVGDKGIDGQARFEIDSRGSTDRILVSVKGGATVNPSMVRDLLGTVESQRAAMGVLVTLASPTTGMIDAANHSGVYRHPANGQTFPKVQIRTVSELLSGHRTEAPLTLRPFTAAQRSEAPQAQLSFDVG